MVIVDAELRIKEVVKTLHDLRDLRTEAMHQPGYISGNTLVGVEDPPLIVIVTIWESVKDWKAWEKSEAQKKIFRKIMPFLLEKSKIKIYRYLSYEAKLHIADDKED